MKSRIMKLKQVKVFETETIAHLNWAHEVLEIFEGREDTTTYLIWSSENYYEKQAFDIYLIEECGCQEGEKIIIERGNW